MKIENIHIMNQVTDGELLTTVYDFYCLVDEQFYNQSIFLNFNNDGTFKTDYFPKAGKLNVDLKVLNEEVIKLEEQNDTFSFYKKIEEDVLSLSLDFKAIFYQRSLHLTTVFENHFITLEIYNLKYSPGYKIKIKKICNSSEISNELYAINDLKEFNLKKVLNGNNRLKYILDSNFLDFIKEYNYKVLNYVEV